MNWILKHKLVSILIVFLLSVAAWYFLSGSSTSAPVLSSGASQGEAPGTSELVASLLALRAVTLSGTIFSDPSFQALQDFTTPVVPEPVGRPDPFAPLPPENQPSANSTKSAQIFAPAH